MNIKKRKELSSGYEAPRLSDGRERIVFDGFESAREREEERRSAVLGFVVLSAFLLLFLTVIFAICLKNDGKENERAVISEDLSEDTVLAEEVIETSFSVSKIYEKCIESVVSISTKNGRVSSVGSGFVYSEDGYIATANHVIEGANEIDVIFSDGKRLSARVVGGNALCDIALLKIEGKKLSALDMGNSHKLVVGQEVAAIGTPASLDYAGSVSSGEISYVNRIVKIYDQSSDRLEKKMNLIQTSVPLNPGNSGCPLLDGSGRVVGMVTMKLGSEFDGMGFAIPADSVCKILDAMKEGRFIDDELLSCVVTKGARLGIFGTNDKEGDTKGVRITDFGDGDCDAAVKLKKGDLIVDIGSEKIDSTDSLVKILEDHSAGQSISVTVIRSGQSLTFDIFLVS